MRGLIIKFVIAVFIGTVIVAEARIIDRLRGDNMRLKANQEVLLDSLELYVVANNLSAARVNTLEMTVSEYKRYRAEDAELIAKLRADILAGVASVSLQNSVRIGTAVRDSVIYRVKDSTIHRIRDEPIDTVRIIRYDSEWTSLYGHLCGDSLDLYIRNRERLLITENLERKKLWFIRLPPKIFGYKNKSVNAVSLNPDTKIVGLEYVRIYK